MTTEEHDQHRRFNYRISVALDMLKLGMILEEMVKAGRMNEHVAKTFDHQAHGLLTAIRNENHRAFGVQPEPVLY